MAMMHKNRSVNLHQFAMVPRADIPRASFAMQKAHKTTFDAGKLVPILCEEILPGDTFNVKMTAFVRMSTPIFPLMDNLHLDTFFFFVPNRLVWDNWQKFMGEQIDPGDSIDYIVPTTSSPAGGFAVNSLFDQFGLPTAGQVSPGESVGVSALPLRAYNLIWNEWFRDQNMQDSLPVPRDDGPDAFNIYQLQNRGKRHDYFTSCLPFPQKGESVTLPLGTTAPVIPTGDAQPLFYSSAVGPSDPGRALSMQGAANDLFMSGAYPGVDSLARWKDSKLVADLSAATAATVNQLRQSFQVQKLLERDARGGTRYTEIVRAHFGVVSPDARLQRPEYLGGGSTPIIINPVAQTSETADTPLGTLSGVGTALANGHGFSQSFTEHGYVIGLACVRGDLSYQQGKRKHWSRRTRYDFYFPAFAMLGEQAVLTEEIYCTGSGLIDNTVFGYQERWAEYRYSPSQISGFFRSTTPGTLDAWHLAQRFSTPPVLSPEFIVENPPMNRILAVGFLTGAQFLFDSFWDMRVARPLPLYSVPGLIDHF